MHTESIEQWMHDHSFGQDVQKVGERRTQVVIIITAVTMAVEIAAGVIFGSMALLADGLHMGSHASALMISAFAYVYTRRHARDDRYNFGTGKVNSLAAFASAVLLAVFALIMALESAKRFAFPVPIEFNWAIGVAVIGLAVNGLCLVILKGFHTHGEQDHQDLGHDHPHDHDHGHSHGVFHGDHNLWSAYLHVLADALTSVLAIVALLAGKYFGLVWLDPLMGVLGAVLVVRWSWGLLKSSAGILLDMQVSEEIRTDIRRAVESHEDNRVSDLHVWAVGPEIYAAELAVVTSDPKEADHYWQYIPPQLGVVHLTVEVRQCSTPNPSL